MEWDNDVELNYDNDASFFLNVNDNDFPVLQNHACDFIVTICFIM